MRGLQPGALRGAHEPLDQPGAERVEPLDPAQVDRDARGPWRAQRRPVDHRLELVRVLHRPGAGGELQALAGHGGLQLRLGGQMAHSWSMVPNQR